MEIRTRYTTAIAGLGAAALIVAGAACNSGATAKGRSNDNAAYCTAVKDLAGRIDNYNAASKRGAGQDELVALITLEVKSIQAVGRAAAASKRTAIIEATKYFERFLQSTLNGDLDAVLSVVGEPGSQAAAETFASDTKDRCGIELPEQDLSDNMETSDDTEAADDEFTFEAADDEIVIEYPDGTVETMKAEDYEASEG